MLFRSAARTIRELVPEVVLNLAAMTDVDANERDPAGSERANAEAPGAVARAATSS